MLNLLRARQRIYRQVKWVQRIYFGLAFLLPVVSLAVALNLEDAKPWVSLIALIAGAFEALLIESWRKDKIKTAARIQEEFDCTVLDMPWNHFTAGKAVSAEKIRQFANPSFPGKRESQLRDWYPENVRHLPAHIARLVCQRTNLWYDSAVRITYRNALWIILVGYAIGLLIFAWSFPVSQLILVVLVPFGPFFTWTVREHHRQSDTIKLVDRLLSEIDGSLDRFTKSDDCSEVRARARELQDAIFAHRSSSPLVSDIVYRLMRSKLEDRMTAGAASFIRKVEQSMEDQA